MRRPGRYFRPKILVFLTITVAVGVIFVIKKNSTQFYFETNFVSAFKSFDTSDNGDKILSSSKGWPRVRVISSSSSSLSKRYSNVKRDEEKKSTNDNQNQHHNFNTSPKSTAESVNLVPNQSCRLVNLPLDDPEINHLFKHVEPLNCNKEKNWVYVDNSSFVVDKEAVKKHGQITCTYTKYWRVTDYKTASKKYENYQSGSPLTSDFFKAECTAADGNEYKNVHASAIRSTEALNRSKTKTLPVDGLNLNVYIIGFDSLSRMTFMRKMPKTFDYLKTKLNAVVLEGYNIVGDGTPQALIPILTGKTEIELPLTRKRFAEANFVNVYPFIWNDFKNASYVTLYGEDAAAFGTFTYRLKGFSDQPTDHYMRTFYTVTDVETKRHNNAKFCWGSEPHHKVHFDYVESFWRAYPSMTRKFAFQFHSVLSHDDINMVEVADVDITKHLQTFESNGFLNDTLLIFMSDHGHRFSSLRETQQGKLEERLPLFAFVLPPWFEKKYPEAAKNLRKNAGRLTTPFDIYPTLRSILHFDYPPKLGDVKSRSISLFDEIPTSRTCADAGIETHWCACLSWEPASPWDGRVKYIAQALVEAINQETERERALCSKLTLKSIEKAWRYAPSADVMRYKKAKDKDGFEPDLSDTTEIQVEYFQLNVRTMPGDALYEASVTFDKRVNEIILNLNDVSHINKFGDLPHCIIDKDYFLAKWCVCYDKF